MKSGFFVMILCASLVFGLSGCFRTNLTAPVKQDLVLLSKDQPTSFHKEYKNWYLFAGLLPIWTTQPEEIIEKENLSEVRVQTEDTVTDGVITFVTGLLFLGVFPQTVVIDGNRAGELSR